MVITRLYQQPLCFHGGLKFEAQGYGSHPLVYEPSAPRARFAQEDTGGRFEVALDVQHFEARIRRPKKRESERVLGCLFLFFVFFFVGATQRFKFQVFLFGVGQNGFGVATHS